MNRTTIAGLSLCALFAFSGCGPKYKVDYCGQKQFYRGAKDSYAAGSTVTVYYYMIATDTSYHFYLDGEDLLYEYESGKGIRISFVMPEHDVTLRCGSRNDMVAEPPGPEPEFERPKEEDMLAQYLCSGENDDRTGGYYLRIYSAQEPKKIWIEQETGKGTDSYYLLPDVIYTEICGLADQYGLDSWQDTADGDTENAEDTFYESFWLRRPDGTKVSVSSRRQPENGAEAFRKLSGHILSYIDGSVPVYVFEQ